MVDQAELLFSEILNSLSQIAGKKFGTGTPNSIMKTPELRHQIAELEGILQKEKLEFEVRLPLCVILFCFSKTILCLCQIASGLC